MDSNILNDSVITEGLNIENIIVCTLVSLILGLLIALVYMYRSSYSKNFVITLVLLPCIVQIVISLVNGHMGTGIAVMGAFSLIRFRSAPGGSKEITNIFLTMAVGIATGMGYLFFAVFTTVLLCFILLVLTISPFANGKVKVKSLRVTLPEDIDYTGLFDDIFKEYMNRSSLDRVRLTNLGSLYELHYTVEFKDLKHEKEVIDKIRVRNRNLNIVCANAAAIGGEL